MRERKRTSEKLHTVRRVLWWIVAVPGQQAGLTRILIALFHICIPLKQLCM